MVIQKPQPDTQDIELVSLIIRFFNGLGFYPTDGDPRYLDDMDNNGLYPEDLIKYLAENGYEIRRRA